MSVCPGCGRCRECGQRTAPAPIYPQPTPYWYWDGWRTAPYPYPTWFQPTAAPTITITNTGTSAADLRSQVNWSANTGGAL
jgi:hypothetical protein